ncbi:hypothetical protein ACIRSF_00055 [Streptomyces rubiginosohelvolus]
MDDVEVFGVAVLVAKEDFFSVGQLLGEEGVDLDGRLLESVLDGLFGGRR